ncbi:MAG TPA: porin family protein, partial [Phaeodactylibacter sp.]|nr:porin family protein [Phaeodactylibacter sp.]
KSGLQFGLKAGLDAQPRQTTGLIGLFARYRLSGRWALQLEPQYKLRSDNLGQGLALDASKEQTTFYPTVAQYNQQSVSITRLHFVELPLTALYQVHPKWQLLGGGQLVHISNAFRSANNESRAAADSAYSAESSAEANRSPNVLRWDAGLILGVDYQLHPALSVDLRYVQGLYDLTNDAFFMEEDDYLNSSVQLSIKWRW